jgi:hypothetical protein
MVTSAPEHRLPQPLREGLGEFTRVRRRQRHDRHLRLAQAPRSEHGDRGVRVDDVSMQLPHPPHFCQHLVVCDAGGREALLQLDCEHRRGRGEAGAACARPVEEAHDRVLR